MRIPELKCELSGALGFIRRGNYLYFYSGFTNIKEKRNNKYICGLSLFLCRFDTD